VERARQAVTVASARAASIHLLGGPEIEDPVGKPARVARQVGAEIAELVSHLAVSLFGIERAAATPAPPPPSRGGIFSRYRARPKK
jgi:hypothetical protein